MLAPQDIRQPRNLFGVSVREVFFFAGIVSHIIEFLPSALSIDDPRFGSAEQIAAIIAPLFVCAGIGFVWGKLDRPFDSQLIMNASV